MLKELKTQHRNIIQMSFNGFRNNEIAEKLSMSQGTISMILRSSLGQAYLNGLHDRVKEQTIDVRKQLIGMNKKALDAISNILDPKAKAPFNVQLTAAKDVLDRNGYKPTDKFEVDVHSQKSDEEIDAEITAMEVALSRSLTKEVDASNKLFTISQAEKKINLDPDLEPESDLELDPELDLIEAKLADPEFNPFKNID